MFAIKGTISDIARYVKRRYRDQFVCSSSRHKTWYHYKDHRWQEDDGATELRRILKDDVADQFHQAVHVKEGLHPWRADFLRHLM